MEEMATKKGGWLGRVIVVLVVWVVLAAGAYYALVVLTSGGAAVGPAADGGPTPTVVEWTPGLIAERPAAFLESAIARARDLAGERQRGLEELSRRREGVQAQADERQRALVDARNVRDRLRRAYEQARDEGRATFGVAGQTFTAAQAERTLADLEKQIEEGRPLAEEYARTAGEYAAREAELRGEIEAIQRLRERLQLELERARLDAKNVSAAELQRVEEQLRGWGNE